MPNGGTVTPNIESGPGLWNPIKALDWTGQQIAGVFNYGSTARPGGYPTGPQPAPQPPEQLTTQWAQSMGERAGWLAELDYDRNKTVFEAQLEYWDNIIKDADNPIIKEGAIKRKEEIEVQLQQAEVRRDAAAQSVKAIPAVLQNPSLINQWEELVAEYGIAEYYNPSAAATYDQVEGGPQSPQISAPGTGVGEVGLYNPELAATSGYGQPVTPARPTETPTAAAQPFQPIAAGAPIADTGLGGVVEGAYAGDVIGGGALPEGNYPMAAYRARHGTLGGGTTSDVSPFTGPEPGAEQWGVPTPKFQGFKNYRDLTDAFGPQYSYGPYGARDLSRMPDMGEGWKGLSDAQRLNAWMSNYPENPRSSGEYSWRGADYQTIDMGQGIQEYKVRRDNYGNVSSYTPMSQVPSYRGRGFSIR